MKKLFQLKIKDNDIVSGHLNEFNSLFSQLTSKSMNIDDDEMNTIFLLCSLPSSWDTFCGAINNFVPCKNLIFNDVMSTMLIEKIHKESLDSCSHGPDSNCLGYSCDYGDKNANQSRSKNKGRRNV